MLNGQVAIVTGAAKGIGVGIATVLRERGATVVLADIDEAQLAHTVSALNASEGSPATGIATDVTQASSVESLVAEVLGEQGRLDILVNNAGILVAKDFVDHTEEDWDRVLDVNLRSMFLCCRSSLRPMLEAGSGKIVNIASMAAFHFTVNHVAYAVSKAGVVALTRDLAYELAPRGVRVNAIAPGPIATPMTETMGEGLRSSMGGAVRIGRWGKPADIGNAVAYLVSEEASYVTGQTLPVAGAADLAVATG